MVVDKPAGVVVHPARGPLGRDARPGARRTAPPGGEDPVAGGDRPPPRPRHLGAAGRRQERRRAPRAQGAARPAPACGASTWRLVVGRPSARTGTIEGSDRDRAERRDRTLMSIDSDEPREARTHFEIVESLPAATRSCSIALDTGRTHQIRVHLAAIGHPVFGDQQYGVPDALRPLRRQFLHAARLAFPHPVTGETVDVELTPCPGATWRTALRLSRAGALAGSRSR